MSLQGFIRHNFWLKFFALFLAILTWVTVRFAISRNINPSRGPLATTMVREIGGVPVSVLVNGGGTSRYAVNPHEVTVFLSGTAAVLDSVRGLELRAFVNLAEETISTNQLRKVEVYGPVGVTVLRVNPPDVLVGHLPEKRSEQ